MWIHAVVSSCFIYVWHCLALQDIRRSFWSAWQSGSLDLQHFFLRNPIHVTYMKEAFLYHIWHLRAYGSVWCFSCFFSIMRIKTTNKQQRRCSSLHDLHGSRSKTHARHLVSEWHLQIWMCIFASVAKDCERAAKGSRKVWIHLLD